MINNTDHKIRYTSFKFFLEKGYEATNIRDICKVVDIQPSSLYFYYKSKQDLFFSIYDEIWNEKIKFKQNIDELKSDISPENKFKILFLKTIDYHSRNIMNEKLLLRYHLFPAEEIATLVKDKFKFWSCEENKIAINIINECLKYKILYNKYDVTVYLQEYNKFVSNLIYDMLIYSIKISFNDQIIFWDKFWNCITNNCINEFASHKVM